MVKVLVAFIIGYPVMVIIELLVYLVVNTVEGIKVGHTALAFYLIPLEILEAFHPLAMRTFFLYAPVSIKILVLVVWTITSFIVYKIIKNIKVV